MKCTNCGQQIVDGAQFCQYCGAVQSSQPEQMQYAPTSQPEQMQYAPTTQPEPMQYAPTSQPEQMQYAPTTQPPKKSKAPVVIIVVALCVLIAAGGALGVILGLKGCKGKSKNTNYDRSTPKATAQSLVNALNNENSKEAYKCFSPSMIKMVLYFGMPDGYRGLLFDSNDNPEPEVYDAANSALKLAHKKYDCKISYKNVTENSTSDSKSTLTGELYFGNINVGELQADFVKENNSWYFSNIDTSRLDYEKLQSIFGKYGSFSRNAGYYNSDSDW